MALQPPNAQRMSKRNSLRVPITVQQGLKMIAGNEVQNERQQREKPSRHQTCQFGLHETNGLLLSIHHASEAVRGEGGLGKKYFYQ